MDSSIATTFLNSVDRVKLDYYKAYWTTITPKDNKERFKRWLFAYASVHTTWKSNVSLYNHLKDCNWLQNATELKKRIIDSRAGLYNNRTRFIMQFADVFWKDPVVFDCREGESWVNYRNRVDTLILGLGRAKIAFAQEMINPLTVHILCTDVHLIRAYGFSNAEINKHIKDSDFDSIELHWLSECVKNNIPSALARAMYWDTKQKKLNSRYWSYLFETDELKESINNIEGKYMSLLKAKEEFINTISKRMIVGTDLVKPDVIPAVKHTTVVKEKDTSDTSYPVHSGKWVRFVENSDDPPDTVTGLINWFLTAPVIKLKTTTIAKWSVVLSSGNYELICGNHQFIKPTVIAMRPSNILGAHNLVIGNSDVWNDCKRYGLDMIIPEMFAKIKFMLSFKCMEETYATDINNIHVIECSDDTMVFNIDKTGLLFRQYNWNIPDGITYKLSSTKFGSVEQAGDFVWPIMINPLSALARPCYIIKNENGVVVETKGEAQKYHYTELLKLIDEIGKLDYDYRTTNLKNREKYGLKEVKKYKEERSQYNTGSNEVNAKLNSLGCMVNPEYGSCRFTNIRSDFTIELVDGLGKRYEVNATACVTPLNPGSGDMYVRGCISIKENSKDNTIVETGIPPIHATQWVKLIIPNGIKIATTITKEN